ncbi:hypothetical protein [Nocardia sienata]|uniref:hypothetical protein n=1 Tax=Nocardia sienata TaxID=248552 RepID=UPI0007A47A95|nr:hypothetical protein [Nocardia sienata]
MIEPPRCTAEAVHVASAGFLVVPGGCLLPSSQDAGRVAAGLAYLCGHLEDIRSVLGDDGADPGSPLNRLLAVVRSGSATGFGVALEAVHTALQARGDARGLYGHHRSATPIGVRHLEVVYRCPLARCMGRTADEVHDDPPRCALTGRELLRERLS